MSGLTLAGFERKRLADIKSEIEQRLRDTLGASINLTAPSVLATIVGIFSEREDLVWQLSEAVYNSSYPDTAEGTSLDNVVAITGLTRQPATKSTLSQVFLFGTVGTVVPSGTVLSVDGNPTATFVTDADVTLIAGNDEVQSVSFGSVPVSGSFRLISETESTVLIPSTADATFVQNALNALNRLAGVTVTGSFALGFTITFSGTDGKLNQNQLTFSDNTLYNAGTVSIVIGTTTQGVPQGTASVTAQNAGYIQAASRTLTVIATPVTGLDRVINFLDATPGQEVETDTALRLRRSESLQVAGAATIEAIVSALRNVTGVTAVLVIENPTDVTDSDGRPPHSFECVVLGGADQVVGQKIWQVKPAGIRTVGAVSVTIVDTVNITHTIKFNRPIPVPIYITLNLVTNPSLFPANGVALAQELLIERAASRFKIGDNVIVIPTLLSAIDAIPGIIDADIYVGTAASPTLSDNIAIAINQVSTFDSSRIVVNVT